MSAQQLLAVLCLVFLVGQTTGFVVQSNEYCPINPRKAGQTLVPNGEAFSFLLTCPLGQPRWGVSQGDWQDLYYSQSANSYAQSSDTDVFLYQSAFSNGVNDPRQGACVSWEHAFRANVKAQLFSTGSGKPVIVGQDRRFEASELFVNRSYGLNSLGQWLYSICDDASCASATVPKPFWGRRIGEPLFQDTMAELAYFPFPPDWAFNSPRLGTTILTQNQFDSGFDSLNPTEIASTYVYNNDGEKLLVLLVNGQFVGKTPFGESFSSISEQAWFLTWCQDEDCEHWGVFALPNPDFDDSNIDTDSLRPAITTGLDGQTVYVVTRASLPQIDPTIQVFKLTDISPGAEARNILMQDIYYDLIGGPAALDGLQVNTPGGAYPFLLTDTQITLGTIGPDVHPLNYAYGGRGYRIGGTGPRRPAIACVDLEDTGVQSDPWCTWTTYWQIVSTSSPPFSPPLGLEPVAGAFYDIVFDECADDIYVISSAPVPYNSSLTSTSHSITIVGSEETYNWPPTQTGYLYFNNSLNIPAPYPATWLLNHDTTTIGGHRLPPKGRRTNAIAGANGRPFFTWADLNHGLYDSAPVVWGTCAVVTGDNVDYECRTIMDSIELGTMGYVHTSFGQTLLLSAPDGLPVMIYWFDHFGGSPPSIPFTISGNTGVERGLVTNKPLIVMCLDAYCDSASVATFTPAQMADIVNRAINTTATSINPYINVDATFADDTLILLINEGGRWDEGTANPLRLWRTNRWASPTGLPCTDQNAGETAVADGIVYYCTRIRVGSDDAELYVGTLPRPWTRLFEWVRMDWGYPLRNLGGFIGWGASYGDDTYAQISTDKDPWWTENSQTYLNIGGPISP